MDTRAQHKRRPTEAADGDDDRSSRPRLSDDEIKMELGQPKIQPAHICVVGGRHAQILSDAKLPLDARKLRDYLATLETQFKMVNLQTLEREKRMVGNVLDSAYHSKIIF